MSMRPGFVKTGLAWAVLVLVHAMTWAAFAGAESGANWRINGANVSAGLLPSLKVKELESGLATLLTKVSGTSVAISCTGANISEGRLETEGRVGDGGGKGRFTGCVMKLNGVTSSTCEPINGIEKGVILPYEVTGLLILHSGAGVIRIQPVSGETLALVEMGEECSIGEKLPISGSLTLKDSAVTSEAVTHLVTEDPLTDIWVLNKTAEHDASIDGTAILELVGAHAGMKWSGLPG